MLRKKKDKDIKITKQQFEMICKHHTCLIGVLNRAINLCNSDKLSPKGLFELGKVIEMYFKSSLEFAKKEPEFFQYLLEGEKECVEKADKEMAPYRKIVKEVYGEKGKTRIDTNMIG